MKNLVKDARRIILRAAGFAVGVVLKIEGALGVERLLLMPGMHPKFGYLLCRVLPRALVEAAIYDVFYNRRTGQLDYLHEIASDKIAEGARRVAALRNNIVGRCLRWRNARTRSLRSNLKKLAPAPPLRVLVATRSWHFMKPVVKALANNDEMQVTELDLNLLDASVDAANRAKLHRRTAVGTLADAQYLDKLTEWRGVEGLDQQCQMAMRECDVILIDWLNHNALWAIANAPLDKRVVVRVHSYEVFSYFPMLLNLGRIDGLIFISAAIRDAFHENWGWLVPTGLDETILDNIRTPMRVAPSAAASERRRTLLMVQYGPPVKDLDFALTVFEALLKVAPEFKLLLAGNPPARSGNEDAQKLERRMQSLPTGSIQELGYVTDVASLYVRSGFILSTSRREGSHESVIEGMSLGCIPAIRDWPLLERFGGARRAFPGVQCWQTAEEMSNYIYLASANFEQESQKAIELSKRFYSRSHVDGYSKFLLEVSSHG